MNDLNFVTARFSNNDRTTVEATWEDQSGDLIVTYHEAIEGDAAWENILTHISIDTLHENTYNYIKSTQEEYKKAVLDFAKRDGLIYDIKENESSVYNLVVSKLFEPFDAEKNKEDLFLLKLQLFEQDAIKKSKNKEKKAELRKAKTIRQAIRVTIDILEDTSGTTLSVEEIASAD